MGSKKFKNEALERIPEMYGMTLEEHSRKQIQMHMAAKAIAGRLAKKTNKFSAKNFLVYI